jgi:hypothetical protein
MECMRLEKNQLFAIIFLSANQIVIGNYPPNTGRFKKTEDSSPGKSTTKQESVVRCVEFYDPETGLKIGEIVPPDSKIISLNSFNPTGEFLASGMCECDLLGSTYIDR